MKKRLAALLLCILLLCGCGLNENELIDELVDPPVTSPAETMTLSFNASESLEPYAETTALNFQLSKLIWEPLYELNADLSAQPVLAASCEQIDDLRWRVRLNAGRTFWDGQPVRPEDVIFSYQKALRSTRYAHLENSISSIAADGDSLIVTLVRPDHYCCTLLDFPILRQTAVLPDEDGQAEKTVISVPYAGTGLYIPTFNTETVTLNLNDRHPDADGAGVRVLTLTDSPDFATMNSAISAQLSDGGYSDLTGGLKPSVSGNVFSVAQNHLVFLGFSAYGKLTDASLRRAVSLSLNRVMLNSFYSGYAVSAVTPFHPDFYAAAGKSCSALVNDAKAAAELLAQSAMPETLSLVYCSDNPVSTQLALEIVRQLNAAGFSVTADGQPEAAYLRAVRNGRCDLYVGEVKLANDYSFLSLLSENAADRTPSNTVSVPESSEVSSSDTEPLPAETTVRTAVSELAIRCSSTLRNALDAFLAGGGIDAFLTAFDAELPFIPLLYRSGMVAYAKKYDITPTAVFDNAFDGVEKTTITVYPDAKNHE